MSDNESPSLENRVVVFLETLGLLLIAAGVGVTGAYWISPGFGLTMSGLLLLFGAWLSGRPGKTKS